MSDSSIVLPKWYWVIAVLALVWNLFGGFDYVNSVSLNADYLSNYPPEMTEFIETMPAWAKAAWGLAIASAILGSLGLVLRKSWAFKAYISAVFFMIISFGYQFTADNMPEVEGGMIMTIIVWGIAFFLLWFARMANGKGWLR